MHVVVQARPRQAAVDLDAADPHLEKLLHQLDRLARQPAGQERSEVVAAVLAHPPGECDARIVVPQRQLEIGIGLVVPQQDVVARLLLLDPVVLDQQRLGRRIRGHEVDVHRLRHHRRQARLMVARQVRRRPFAERRRLADVEDLPLGVLEDIDARPVRKLPDAFSEMVVVVVRHRSRDLNSGSGAENPGRGSARGT